MRRAFGRAGARAFAAKLTTASSATTTTTTRSIRFVRLGQGELLVVSFELDHIEVARVGRRAQLRHNRWHQLACHQARPTEAGEPFVAFDIAKAIATANAQPLRGILPTQGAYKGNTIF